MSQFDECTPGCTRTVHCSATNTIGMYRLLLRSNHRWRAHATRRRRYMLAGLYPGLVAVPIPDMRGVQRAAQAGSEEGVSREYGLRET
jgi:hypothetical protein